MIPQPSKRVVWTDVQGRLNVTTPVRCKGEEAMTDEELIARARENDLPPDAIDVREMGADEILGDRTFRDAWHLDGGRIAVRMDRAREIHLARIRFIRDAELARLDVEWMRAFARGDTKGAAEVEAQKQALRDLPATLDLAGAATPDELKALWPAGLPKPSAPFVPKPREQ
jgi:hypothetical protein